jgi:hypothetical protein
VNMIEDLSSLLSPRSPHLSAYICLTPWNA